MVKVGRKKNPRNKEKRECLWLAFDALGLWFEINSKTNFYVRMNKLYQFTKMSRYHKFGLVGKEEKWEKLRWERAGYTYYTKMKENPLLMMLLCLI